MKESNCLDDFLDGSFVAAHSVDFLSENEKAWIFSLSRKIKEEIPFPFQWMISKTTLTHCVVTVRTAHGPLQSRLRMHPETEF
jgi:hypothetical protein